MSWQTPVFDRTAADVAARADKCYFSAALLNRIEGNTAVLAQASGTDYVPRSWAETDFLTPTGMQHLLAGLAAVRAAYYTLPTTPAVPALPAVRYDAVNDIEHIQHDLYTLHRRNTDPDRLLYAGQTIGVI